MCRNNSLRTSNKQGQVLGSVISSSSHITGTNAVDNSETYISLTVFLLFVLNFIISQYTRRQNRSNTLAITMN